MKYVLYEEHGHLTVFREFRHSFHRTGLFLNIILVPVGASVVRFSGIVLFPSSAFEC